MHRRSRQVGADKQQQGVADDASVMGDVENLTILGEDEDAYVRQLVDERMRGQRQPWQRFFGVTKEFGFVDEDGYNARLHAAQENYDRLMQKRELIDAQEKRRAVVAVRVAGIRAGHQRTRDRNAAFRESVKPPQRQPVTTLPSVNPQKLHHVAQPPAAKRGGLRPDSSLRRPTSRASDKSVHVGLRTPATPTDDLRAELAVRRVGGGGGGNSDSDSDSDDWVWMRNFPRVDGTDFIPPVPQKINSSAFRRMPAPPVARPPSQSPVAVASTPSLMAADFEPSPPIAATSVPGLALQSARAPCTDSAPSARSSRPASSAAWSARRPGTLGEKMHREPLSARGASSRVSHFPVTPL